jgi:uncharacterized protein YdcH (DUF465 family)
MKDRLNYYSRQFSEVESTISALKKSEAEFKRLFSLGSKEKVLENIHSADSGSLDMDNLKQQINCTIETIEK